MCDRDTENRVDPAAKDRGVFSSSSDPYLKFFAMRKDGAVVEVPARLTVYLCFGLRLLGLFMPSWERVNEMRVTWQVHKTETIPTNLNPQWRPFVLGEVLRAFVCLFARVGIWRVEFPESRFWRATLPRSRIRQVLMQWPTRVHTHA